MTDSDWTGMGPNNPAPRLDSTCQCICHTQPGVMHVAACCQPLDQESHHMTDLTREQITELLDGATPGPWLYRPHKYDDWGVVRGGVLNEEWGSYPHLAQVRDPEKLDNDVLSQHRVSGKDPWEGNARLVAAAPDLARTVIALHAQLADAQAAQAMVTKRCAEEADRRYAAGEMGNPGHHILALAPIDGLALVRELRDRAEKDERKCPLGISPDAHEFCSAGTCDVCAGSMRERLVATLAERDRLAAANAVLEAKVAGLAEAAEDAEYDLLQWLECSKALTAAGFNMDGTAEVTAKLTAALSHIKRGKTNG